VVLHGDALYKSTILLYLYNKIKHNIT